MVKPLAPSDVVSAQVAGFPDFVIETWNTVIAKNWSGTQSRIKQDDIMLELIAASPMLINRGDVFARHWLDIEDVYRAEGWVVEYNNPAYNEDYPGYVVFKKNVNNGEINMTAALNTVINLMINRLQHHKEAAFGIPADMISPDTATPEELVALDAAGFVWVDNEGFRGYKMLFNAVQELNYSLSLER